MWWVFFVFVLVSASAVLFAAQGPFRGTPSARGLRLYAAVQYVIAGFVLARLLGWV